MASTSQVSAPKVRRWGHKAGNSGASPVSDVHDDTARHLDLNSRWARKLPDVDDAVIGANAESARIEQNKQRRSKETLGPTEDFSVRRVLKQREHVEAPTQVRVPSRPVQQQHLRNHRGSSLRSANEARASSERAGMSAKVEHGNGGAVQATVLDGEAYFVPELFCEEQDRRMYDQLLREFHGHIRPIRGGKSLGVEPTQAVLDACPTYKEVVTRLAEHFQVEVCYSVVNFYRGGSEGIGAHTDSMQNGANMTIGASFGDPRALLFEHKRSAQQLELPQRNGDVFAFTDVANRNFRHSVPKTRSRVGGRLSIIVWGRQGGFMPVALDTPIIPTSQDIREVGGDWNRAFRSAQTRLSAYQVV